MGALAVVTVAAAGLQAISSIQQAAAAAEGIAQKTAVDEANLKIAANAQETEAGRLRLEQHQLDIARTDELIASSQEETQRRRELRENLSTIDALRASRGLRASPTSGVISRDIRESATNDIRTNKLNRLARADSYQLQSQYAGSLATYSDKTADFYRTRADQVRASGKSAISSTMRAGKIGAATSLVSGAVSAGGSSLFQGSNLLGSQGSVSRSVAFGNSSTQGPLQSFGGL